MRAIRPASLILAAAAFGLPGAALAAKATECTKINVCYCVEGDKRAKIEANVTAFRQTIAEQRKAGKLVGYMSVPLSSAGGGNFDLNMEIANDARAAIEKRFGAEQVYVLNPGTKDADIPGGSGADYMLMWTTLLEGPTGMGEDFDFVYFVGPQDFARFFGFDGNADMAKLDRFYDQRMASNPGFEKAAKGGLTKTMFRNYYGLRASTSASRGAHDEWNIIRTINERRRADPKLGAPNQITVLFDGRGIPLSIWETAVSDGYVGKCAP